MKQPLPDISNPELRSLFVLVEDELEQVRRKYRELAQGGLSCLAGDTGNLSVFAEQLSEQVLRGEGKWLRAGVTLLMAKGIGADMTVAIDMATAIEMTHTATLVHDDVLDQANLRRGQPSVSSLWGNPAAVLGGDVLLSLAYRHLIETVPQACQREMAESVVRVCLGEIAQQKTAGRSGLSEEDYFEIIEKKTASLFVSCVRCPALFADGIDEIDFKQLSDFGSNFGLAFQVVDDLMDFLSSADDMGKPIGRDSSQNKPTLAVIHFLDNNPEYLEESSDFTFFEWKQLLQQSGSFSYVSGIAENLTARAETALDEMKCFKSEEAREALRSIVRFCIGRLL